MKGYSVLNLASVGSNLVGKSVHFEGNNPKPNHSAAVPEMLSNDIFQYCNMKIGLA